MTMQSEPISILQLSTADSCFDDRLTELLAWENVSDQNVEQIVADILAAVRQRGDQALIEFTGSSKFLPTSFSEHWPVSPQLSAMHWNWRRNEFAVITSTRSRPPGTTGKRTAPCWGSRSPHWTGWAFMCPGAKPAIRRRF